MNTVDLDDFDEALEKVQQLLGDAERTHELWDANELINQALRQRPEDVRAWLLKSQVHSALEDDAAALAAVEMAVRLAPRRAETHYVRATVLADSERHPEALQAIERSFQLLEADDDWLLEELYFEKATILDALDRSHEALATFESGLRRCPESALLQSGVEPFRREQVRRSFKVIDGGRIPH